MVSHNIFFELVESITNRLVDDNYGRGDGEPIEAPRALTIAVDWGSSSPVGGAPGLLGASLVS